MGSEPARCAITGEATLAGYYARFTDETGEDHFFTMESPTNYRGAEIPTAGATIREVADYIDALGRGGVMRWNPREVRWNGQLLTFLTPVRIKIEAGSPALDQLMAGGSARIRRTVEIDGQPIAGVEITQWIPPLLFRGVYAEQQARS